MDTKILMCGPFPAPVGGVSVHVSRLCRRLSDLGFEVSRCDESPNKKDGIFNIRSLDFVRYLARVRACDIVHVHSSVHMFRLTHIISCVVLNKPVVVTVHSWRAGPLLTTIWRLLFRLPAVEVIYVSEAIRNRIQLPGSVIPAYVPPDIEHEEELPEILIRWIRSARQQKNHIAVSNAYKLVAYNTDDLYGLDLCIDAVSKVEHLAFVFVIANPECATEQIDTYRRRIEILGISGRFLIYEGSVSFTRLLQISDISVRATNTDGDALSVRESLHLSCKTVASDCCPRPHGVMSFQSRNSDDLARKLERCLHPKTVNPRPYESEDYVGEILKEYRSAMY